MKSVNYLNENFPSFNSILSNFLEKTLPATPLPSVCVIAAAGPVHSNAVQFTANGWLISGSSVMSSFPGLKSCTLINDFVGLGYGLLTLDRDSECVPLNGRAKRGDVRSGGPIACVGAGTGLGECYLTSCNGDPRTYECFASEGGHAEFAPRTALEFEMLQHLKEKFGAKNRVSVERVVSGPGISNVYEFLIAKFPGKGDPAVHTEWKAAGTMQGKVVSDNATKCAVCKMAMETFASAYGSEVGVAALKWIPRGGLYVTGGLTPKNLSWIEGDDGEFMKAFRDKGRVSELLEDIPVFAVKVEDLGLRGARELAGKIWRENVGGQEGDDGEGRRGGRRSTAGVAFGHVSKQEFADNKIFWAVAAAAVIVTSVFGFGKGEKCCCSK